MHEPSLDVSDPLLARVVGKTASNCRTRRHYCRAPLLRGNNEWQLHNLLSPHAQAINKGDTGEHNLNSLIDENSGL